MTKDWAGSWRLPSKEGPPGSRHNRKRNDSPTRDDADAPPWSDEYLALRFAAEYVDELRYCEAFGRWYRWRDGVWREDRTLEVFDLIRKTCRDVAAECDAAHTAKNIASAKTVAAIQNLARSDRRLAVSDEVWDRDIWLLNTPDGIVDLRTGEIRPVRRDDYCTRMTSVAPGGDFPIWNTFLDHVTGGDVQLKLYLQRVAGYSLAGSTREHAIIFLYGPGGNGKTVFIITLSGILGGYATSAPTELFTESRFDSHPTSVASLKGARLVTCSETESGRRWAEARLKKLTGGEPVKARFMRRDEFEFTPQFTLVIAGNHKPGLRSVDEAIRRRLHLVPFTVNIPRTEQDPDLPEKLKAEWPGILAWAIEGAVEWAGEGLAPPEAVFRATEDYLEQEDTVGLWLSSDCTTGDPNAFTSSTALYDSWRSFAERVGEPVGTNKELKYALESHGFPYKKSRKARGFLGIRIDTTARYADPDEAEEV